VGFINFAAVITRPNIAKATSILSKHLRNLSPSCLAATEHLISYLYRTRSYTIKYSGNLFLAASDAAFADHIQTRHSS
ncbi:hypothetical protein K432DRAFT_273138, partial [Lepidopterella palustris CBS 459.81]